MPINTVIKRNGQEVNFDSRRIFSAIQKAFSAENISGDDVIEDLTDEVILIAETRLKKDTIATVEAIQDIVEEVLMDNHFHKVARRYIVYREQHKKIRQDIVKTQIKDHQLQISLENNKTKTFEISEIETLFRSISNGLKKISITEMLDSITERVYNNIPMFEVQQLILEASRERIEKHYDYSFLSSRISLNFLYNPILSTNRFDGNFESKYKSQFSNYIQKGIELDMLSPNLKDFDLDEISKAIVPDRDNLFLYLGTQILIDRYLLRDRSEERSVYELPQWFWMRVAMGLAYREKDKTTYAIQFYNVLSKMDLVSSTPTLFNSGTTHSQMSSCYLNTLTDSLGNIFKLYGDNAQLSKWAGGIGTDWTPIRATGSKIHGTNGLSQGVIPFIKIFNDVALAVNQGGKRKGAMCAYMEIWHLDFEQFLELKKNTGDERRRTHDINTACWIPDLFMKRVEDGGKWTFFCPSDVPELHDLYGKDFEKKYEEYESKNISRARSIDAGDLWRKMLTMLYETGHPWITFKDPINLRSPQDHSGVVHSSNLCTEITLNTTVNETAVCNLASINLSHMLDDSNNLDEAKIEQTIETGIRMLDNVIDNNFYPTKEAEVANFRHRAIGLGMMGFQDALFKKGISYDSQENLDFSDISMEMISYYSIKASAKLAKEKGSYETYKGSKWDRGIFPLDTLDIVEEHRGRKILVDRSTRLDWDELKSLVSNTGMRNSNVLAIAPTATIANISGVYPCTEPVFKNIYMKENLSGNFIVINRYLIDELDKLGLWNDKMLNAIKIKNGSIQEIKSIPASLHSKYKETFEIEPEWIIKSQAKRMKWIDQSASCNVFINTKSGKLISDTYKLAWNWGLKTTYYLRTLGATQVNKTIGSETTESDKPISEDPHVTVSEINQPVSDPTVCSILDPDCEACQ